MNGLYCKYIVVILRPIEKKIVVLKFALKTGMEICWFTDIV